MQTYWEGLLIRFSVLEMLNTLFLQVYIKGFLSVISLHGLNTWKFRGPFIRFTWYLQAPLFDLHENLRAPLFDLHDIYSHLYSIYVRFTGSFIRFVNMKIYRYLYSIYMVFTGSFIRITWCLQAPLFYLHGVYRLLHSIDMKIDRLLYSI